MKITNTQTAANDSAGDGRIRCLLVAVLFLTLAMLTLAPGAWAQETKKESPTRPQGLLTKPAKLDKKPLPPKPQAEEAGSDKIVAEKDSKGNLYASGELIVTYAADATAADEKKASEAVDARVDEDFPRIDAEALSFPAIKDEQGEKERKEALEQKKQVLERDPDVESVSYNYLREPNFVPNDPYFVGGYQWDLQKIGTTSAWDRTTGYGAKVAVLDTGVDTSHPDLRGKVAWQWDFFNRDSVANVDYGYSASGHGTHVSGTIAATANNGTGIAGVAPQAQILAAKVCGPSRVGDTKDDVNGWAIRCPDAAVIDALNHFSNYASYSGIKVANLSLGGYAYSSAYHTAVNRASNSGIVVVAAAGNDNTSAAHYPSAFASAIAVTATDHRDRKAPYSNFGSYVDVAAPGGNTSYSGGGILSTIPGGRYSYMQGTSMAAPHVSGLAALLASQDLNNAWIRYRIEATATDLGIAGKDTYYGYGRINARSAVTW